MDNKFKKDFKKNNFDKARSDRRQKPAYGYSRPSYSDESDEVDECTVSGRNAVKELLESGRDIDKLFVRSGDREGSVNLILGIAAERKIPIIEVDTRKLDQLSHGGRHQGVVAIAAERNYSSVEEIIAYAEERSEKPFIIVLDGVEDPHNLGAVIRSAECLGAHGVIIPKRRAVGLTSTVAKASAGAIEHVRIAKVTNIAQTIDELKERGLWLYAADMDGVSCYSEDLSGPVALVLGSEGFGISRLVKEKCDYVISVPMYGSLNSMNVSCAATVLMAEVARQRNK